MSEQDIIRKVKLLREMQRMAEDAQAEAEALKDEIKAYMGSSEELRAGNIKSPGRAWRAPGWTQRLLTKGHA